MNTPISIKTESIEDNSPRISFYEYLIVFVLIIYAGRANTFVESGSFTKNPVGALLPLVLTGILAIRWKVMFEKNFYILIACFTIYFVAISAKYGEIQPTFLLTFIFRFFIVYTVIKALKFNLFKIYENVMFYLAIIGVLMWSLQIILRGDTLFSYLNKIPGISLFSYVTGYGLNAILYSVQPSTYGLLYNITIPRNCGYAQEPGSFAVYLCLAIFINLFITDSDKTSKRKFWVLVIALLSTQSTTGYVIFMVIMAYYILNRNLKRILLLLPFIVILLISISSLPFMSNKIIGLINETGNVNMLVERSILRQTSYAPGRFLSFNFAFKDFLNNPILGLGSHLEKSWSTILGAQISTISGVGNLLAQFGIIGFLFFIIFSIKSSFFFAKYYNYKGKFLFFIIIFFISVSYSVIILPLVMVFWLFQLFAPENAGQKEAENLA
jgi:hypothetical protein